jgi:hypothetical protein
MAAGSGAQGRIGTSTKTLLTQHLINQRVGCVGMLWGWLACARESWECTLLVDCNNFCSVTECSESVLLAYSTPSTCGRRGKAAASGIALHRAVCVLPTRRWTPARHSFVTQTRLTSSQGACCIPVLPGLHVLSLLASGPVAALNGTIKSVCSMSDRDCIGRLAVNIRTTVKALLAMPGRTGSAVV